MSLAISTATPEGICLASDSRQTYRNRKGQFRIGSDSASKLFKLTNKAGLTVSGPAFLPENGVQKNISKFIEDFKQNNDLDKMSLDQVARGINSFFDQKYPWREELKKLENQIKIDFQSKGLELIEINLKEKSLDFKFKDKDGKIKSGIAGVSQLSFILAGYDRDGSHKVFMIYVPGEIQLKRSGKEKGKEYGATWTGQMDVVVRIVLGRDPRVNNLPFVQEAIKKHGKQKIYQQLGSLEYSISWGTMTLQDAIDFCSLIIQTTTAMQRFSDGILANPGDIPGVGGPIDIAIISPNKGFIWICRKSLKFENQEINLDDFSDLPPIRSDKKRKSRKQT